MFSRTLFDQPERLWRFLGIFQSPPLRLVHVQGRGLFLLLLTAFGGLTWFMLWRAGSAYAEMILPLHQTGGVLMLCHLAAHGGMGIRRFIVWQRNSRAA